MSDRNTDKISLNEARTLVLNADYNPLSRVPLSVWSWQDAVTAVFKGKAVVVEEYPLTYVHSEKLTLNVPSVIALKEFVFNDAQVRFTRYNIYLRDKFTCCYCNKKFETPDLTFDHVWPRCRGGKTEWENIATACIKCNQLKNDRTLEETITYPKGHELAGQRMKLNYKPYTPTHEQFRRTGRINYDNLHKTWIDYLYYDGELSED